ncbi:leucine-rich repeat domain-containing protein [Acidiluteibacter ferrifornacis]|nr:hypothetical protein [Acidiluteibacter ferrifornacis]
MKTLISRNTITPLVNAFILSLMISCSKDENMLMSMSTSFLTISDTHFETKLIELGIDSDGIVNQQMLRTDAEKVSRLDLSIPKNSDKITNLNGIEGFTNLTFFSVVGHEIKDVDLSFNIKLDTLILNGNHLTQIDLSNHSNLILVEIQSNELSKIKGLSQSKNLKRLDLSFNNFEEIIIDNPSVEDLLISHNQLKFIDTRNAINLKNVFMIINELTTVNFSSNKLLKTLILSDNKLQSINLEENTHLTHLYGSSNLLTSLDLSNNQQLIDLRVDRNPYLSCIQISNGQYIPNVSISDYQSLNTNCN